MKKILILFIAILTVNVYASEIKIAYIDVENILSNSKQLNNITQQIISEFKTKDNEIKKDATVIKKLLEKFKTTEEDLTKEEKNKQIQQITTLDAKLKNKAKRLQLAFNNRKNEELLKIQDNINNIVKKFAEQNNFDLILYKDAAYVSDNINITDEIAKQLEKGIK